MKLSIFSSIFVLFFLLSQPIFAALNLELTKGVKAPIPIAVMPFATNNSTPPTDIAAVISRDLQYSSRFQVANNQQFTAFPSQMGQIDLSYWQKFNLNAMVIGQVNQVGNQYQVTFSLVNLFNSTATSAAPITNSITTPTAAPAPTATATAATSATTNTVAVANNSTPVINNVTPAATTITAANPAPAIPAAVTPATSTTTNASMPSPSVVGTSNNMATANSVIATQTFTVSGKDLRTVAHQIANIIYQNLTGEQSYFTSKVAFIAVNSANGVPTRYSLQTSDYDGYNIKTLLSSAEPVMSPSFSPKGDRIAFVTYDENNHSSLEIINTAGGGAKVVSGAAGLNNAPAWSPDGSQLAIVLSKTGSPNIYLYSLASGQLSPLTQDTTFINTEPTFSADGKSIIFTSNRSGSSQVYQMDLTSQAIKPLTTDGINSNGQLSIDGNTLLFLHSGDGSNFNVATLDIPSSTLNVLTRDGLVQSTSLAPNAGAAIYSTNQNNHQVLGIVTIDGAVNYYLPSTQNADIKEPDWGPNL